MTERESSRHVKWWHHVLGFAAGTIAGYALSYFTALWVTSITIWSGEGFNTAQAILLILTGITTGLIVGVVQSRLSMRAGFIAAIGIFLVVGLIAGMSTMTPLAWGNTSPLVIDHFLANAGSNPGTVGVLIAALTQAVIIQLSRRKKRDPRT